MKNLNQTPEEIILFILQNDGLVASEKDIKSISKISFSTYIVTLTNNNQYMIYA